MTQDKLLEKAIALIERTLDGQKSNFKEDGEALIGEYHMWQARHEYERVMEVGHDGHDD